MTVAQALAAAEQRVIVLRQLFDLAAAAVGDTALVPKDRDGARLFWAGLRDQVVALGAALEAVRAARNAEAVVRVSDESRPGEATAQRIQMVVPEGGGPPTIYPGKETTPFTVKLTTEGKTEFDRLRETTGLSGSDILELLLRRYGKRVETIQLIPPHTTRTHRRTPRETTEWHAT